MSAAGHESRSGGVRLLPAGEQGLLVELGDVVDPEVNRRVRRLARAISAALGDEVLEVVPTYRSLLVLFDPLRVPRRRLAERIEALGREAPALADEPSRTVRIPVCYGGEHGIDLDFVARHAGLGPEEVVAVHTSASYLVHMLGFTPGFPYLGGMSRRIAAPRLESPRTRVPAGSVGIGGEQTGIYPVESPGGWRLIGRTPLRLFDAGAPRPFLLGAGDVVRFFAVGPEELRAIARSVEAGEYEADIDGPAGGEAAGGGRAAAGGATAAGGGTAGEKAGGETA